jgi:hypothetical protein
MKKKRKTQKRTAAKLFPPPLAKRLVLQGAQQSHALRPMVFWEMTRVWDWTELATTESGETSKAAFLSQMSRLYDHLTDDTITRNSRSMAFIAQVTVPTQRELLSLCDKYGYDTANDETEVPDED